MSQVCTSWRSLAQVTLTVFVLTTTSASIAKPVEIKPQCAGGFEFSAAKKICEPNSSLAQSIVAATKKEDCDKIPGTLSTANKCEVTPPRPTCTPLGIGSAAVSFIDGTCSYVDAVPQSDNTNYVGDCFQPLVHINGAPESDFFAVASTSEDKSKLNVVPAELKLLLFCRPKTGLKSATSQVDKAEVIASGALRTGWVYGMLTLPFKYYPRDNSMSGQVTVGPYIGARASAFGATWIHAISAGLTQASVNTTDAQGATLSTSVSGLSASYGIMFEVSKSTKPLRSGIFIGKDYFGKLNGLPVSHSNQTWIALQVGYDFTD